MPRPPDNTNAPAGTGAFVGATQRWRFSRMRMFSTIGVPSKP